MSSDASGLIFKYVLQSVKLLNSFQDAVQAFELQNKFLNNEILELNKLRRDSEERVRLMSVYVSYFKLVLKFLYL